MFVRCRAFHRLGTVGSMGTTRSALGVLPITLLLLAACGGGAAPAADAAVSDAPAAADVVVATDAAAPGAVESILRMCRMVHACGYSTARFRIPADVCTENAFNSLIHHVEQDSPEQRARYRRMESCAATATSCDAYVRCADFDMPCNGTVMPMCMGTTALRCSTPGGNHLPRIIDCAAVGQTCQDGVCALPAGANECMDPAGVRCDGNTRVWCRPRVGGGNGETREPCPAGTVCQAAGEVAVCQPALTMCATRGARCDGDTAVLCDSGTLPDGTRAMIELRQDCAAVGRRCAPNARGIASCQPVATECQPAMSGTASSARCEGDTLVVCQNGALSRINCASLGRPGCGVYTPPAALGLPYATCGMR